MKSENQRTGGGGVEAGHAHGGAGERRGSHLGGEVAGGARTGGRAER